MALACLPLGCSSATSPASSVNAVASTGAVSPSPGPTAPTSGAPTPSSTPAIVVAPWKAERLTDVRTGDPVTVGGFQGQVVFLEGMATWCPPCAEQQRQAAAALARLHGLHVVYLSVDVDPRETRDVLAAYATRGGFDWPFLVGTPTFLRELSEAVGVSVLNPPSTPIVLLDRTGAARLAEIGIKSADRLVELARALGG